MNEYSRMRQRKPFAFSARGQEYCGHRSRLTHANRYYVRLDESHSVIDGKCGGNRASRAVDVNRDLAVGIFRFKIEQFGDYDVCHGFVDLRSEKDNVLFQ